MFSIDDQGVKARIITAARTEFAQHGFGAGSVRTIGDRAGVTAAMINYYFGGKRALYDEVIAEAQGRLARRLSAALAGDREGIAARLAGAYFDFLADDNELQRLLMRDVLDGGKAASSYVEPLRSLFDEHFGKREETVQLAISLFGAVAGYFLYEPLLGTFLADDPRSRDALARRRRHVIRLARRFEEMKK